MVENIACITLRIVKYSDSASIATVWSRQRGRMSVTVPAGKGREAQRRRAIMMPFSAFEAVANMRPGSEIARLSDVRPVAGVVCGPADPVKSVMSIFLADFLYAVLKESAPDPLMADFLFSAVEQFNRARGAALANFHLAFLYRLGRFLGIAPDTGTYARGRIFDMREARFVAAPPMHRLYLDAGDAQVVYLLSRLNERNLHLLRLSRRERNAILDRILEYYTLHYAPVSSLPSLSIIREIFD